MKTLFTIAVICFACSVAAAEDKTPENLAKEWMKLQVGDWEVSTNWGFEGAKVPPHLFDSRTRYAVRMKQNVMVVRSWNLKQYKGIPRDRLGVAFWDPVRKAAVFFVACEVPRDEFREFLEGHGEEFWNKPHLFVDELNRIFQTQELGKYSLRIAGGRVIVHSNHLVPTEMRKDKNRLYVVAILPEEPDETQDVHNIWTKCDPDAVSKRIEKDFLAPVE